jgi:Flp pilus assembly protein TadG
MFGRRSFYLCRKGGAAIEFAIVAPLFILTLLTLVAYAIYLNTAHAVQQIAADSARIAVAGLNEEERLHLARSYVSSAAISYPFIDAAMMDVDVGDDPEPGQFTVRLSYDAAGLPIWNLFTFTMPETRIERYATIRIGGI